MVLDVTSLLVVNVINLTVTASILPFIMGRTLSPSARYARGALILQALGWALMIGSEQFVGHWLDRALSVASVASMGWGQWWMLLALDHWLGPRRARSAMVVACVLTPIGYFLSFDSYPLRVGWTNGMLALQLCILANACLHPRTSMGGRWRWVLGGCMLVMACFTAARGVMGAFFTALYPSLTAPHPVNVLAMLTTNVALVLGNVAVLVAWRTEAEEQLQSQALTDALTGLLNRRGWKERGEPLWWQQRRAPHQALALMMLDLDYFKRVNDTYGHEAGDEVLRTLGTVVTEVVRRSDIAARIGGEEFALLLPHTDLDAARALDTRLRRALNQRPLAVLGRQTVAFSAGVALADGDDTSLEALLARADAALYQAKENGRGQLAVAPPPSTTS